MSNYDGQDKTPLFDAIVRYANENKISFHTPGHKHGNGIPKVFRSFVGEKVFKLDLSVMSEIDSLHEPNTVIKEAQILAAKAYGADYSFFLVNGTTGGNQAMILSVCDPGDKIIIPRNAHKSVISAVILAGAEPVYVMPKIDETSDLILNLTVEQVDEACRQHPDAKAVLVTSPTYFGLTADLEAIAEVVHNYDKILLVDEAHGGHFHFHPKLPKSAMDSGADMCVQSTHKHLAALSQGSMLHVKGVRIDILRLKTTLQMLQTTSPSYIILGSLDISRHQMVQEGERLLNDAIELCEATRKNVNAIPGLSCLTREQVQKIPGLDLDVTKLTISTKGLPCIGYDMAKILNSEYGIQTELSDFQNVLLFVSLGNTPKDLKKFVAALRKIVVDYKDMFMNLKRKRRVVFPHFVPRKEVNPREALTKLTRKIPFKRSVGKVCAEIVCPYPPGIPVLCPGEVITQEIYTYLMNVLDSGARINGQSDGRLQTIKVLEDNPASNGNSQKKLFAVS
jgi:arginine/lysine/ornithine decarboxylase